MELVQTQGQLTLMPIDGEEEGSCAGYYVRSTDSEGSNITFVIPVPYKNATQLAEAILSHQAEHPEGQAGGPKVETFGPEVLTNLNDHRRPGK